MQASKTAETNMNVSARPLINPVAIDMYILM